MKSSLLCLVAAFGAINFAAAQWTRLTSPTTNNLYAVAFSNERYGFAVGAKGTVLRTNDGGATWAVLPPPDSVDIRSVIIIDSNTVIVATANTNGKSSVYKSITRGNSWHKVLHDDRPFYTTQMPNGNLFSMSTFAYISLNKGDAWLKGQRLNSTSNYNELAFPDNHHGFIGGNVAGDTTDHAEFLRSEDGGQTWYPSYPFAFPNNFAFSSMSAINSDSLFMFTNYDKRFHPKDSSQLLLLLNFRLRQVGRDTILNFRARVINKSFPDIINACKFFSDTLAYAAGDLGNIYISTTSGKKWTKEFRGRVTINGLYMINTNKGYAVGDGGLIVKRDVVPANNILSETLAVRVYPNPANSSSMVSFTLNKSANIILKVTDEKGTVVYTEQSKKYNAGTFMRVIPVANFQRGIYHINVIVDGNLKGKNELLVVH